MAGLSKNTKPSNAGVEDTAQTRRGPTGSLARAMTLLDDIAQHGPLRFAQIQERSQLPKATLHRALNELQNERLVQFDERSLTYQAGFRVLELANHVWSRSDLRTLARDQLEHLCQLSNETVQLSVHSDTHATYLDSVESDNNIRMSMGVGTSIPLYCTGAGKALLASCPSVQQRDIIDRISFTAFTPNTITDKHHLLEELGRIRQLGFAEENEEHFVGIRCMAAPIVTCDDRAVAAVSICGPTFRISEQDLQQWHQWLLDATDKISKRVAPTSTRIC
ncbi:MAG: IclR family transcriptional regulator [Pseudomonadota bacterium]